MREIVEYTGQPFSVQEIGAIADPSLATMLSERMVGEFGSRGTISETSISLLLSKMSGGSPSKNFFERVVQQVKQNRVISGTEFFFTETPRAVYSDYYIRGALAIGAIAWGLVNQYTKDGVIAKDWRDIVTDTQKALGEENPIAMSLNSPQQTDGEWPVFRFAASRPKYGQSPAVGETSSVVEPLPSVTLNGLEAIYDGLPLDMEPMTPKYIDPRLAQRIVEIGAKFWPDLVDSDFENMQPDRFRRITFDVIRTMRKNNVDDFDVLYDFCRGMKSA